MGSIATLHYGGFEVGQWKSYVPLEPLLLFTQEDYTETPTEDDNPDRKVHRFVCSVRTAKRRMDGRGLTIAMCRALVDEFRQETFWRFGMSGREWLTENTTDFDGFLKACKQVYKKFSSRYVMYERKASKKLKRIFDEDYWSEEFLDHFSDAYMCILIRCFLEVAPDDAEVVFDLTDLVNGQFLTIDDAQKCYDDLSSVMYRRIGLTYQLYGFTFEQDPNTDHRLRERISKLSEDQFINHVLVPLLKHTGFERVRPVRYHGRNEFGSDVLPFRHTTPIGTFEYYALQAKAVAIHGTSKKKGNAGEIVSQVTQAMSVSFVDEHDNERKKIDKFVVATNKTIKPDARRVIEDAVSGKRAVVVLDIDAIVELIKKHRLVQYILFTELPE